MRSIIRAILATLVCYIGCMGAFGQSRAIVDYEADILHSIKVGDSTAIALVKNVVFHHNGAIITCDSAVRYNDRYIECFNNVIVNKDSTYIYGDRADFNGLTNIAQVYSPLVKTVDGDMTMYSYDLEFNTLTKIGTYLKGGTISQKDNLMESVEAIYHAEEKDIYFVKDVAMRNEEYTIETDSMGYNFDSEITTFYKKANIWNKDGDYLTADKGLYDRQNDTYIFTENSYVLTQDQQMWADSITYLKTAGISYLFHDIQIHDEVQLALLFGDYGVYWMKDQQAILADNPSVITYEERENSDSVYMRADSIFLFTVPTERADSAVLQPELPDREQLDSVQQRIQEQNLVGPLENRTYPDSLNAMDIPSELPWMDSLRRGRQSLPQSQEQTDSLPPGPLPKLTEEGSELPPRGGEWPTPATEEPRAERREVMIPEVSEADTTATAAERSSEQPKSKRQLRQENRLNRRRQKMREYEERLREEEGRDTVAVVDTLAVEELPEIVADTLPKDSLQRIVRAYHTVKIYRSDMQAVCDSLVAFSIDSTAHLYHSPVLWSDNSQIASHEMHFFSRNEELYRADFDGEPIMSEWVVDSLYNQVAGKLMNAYFKNNEIDRLDVDGNAQTYYYLTESDGNIGGFLVAEGANITFEFDSTKVNEIIYRVNPVYTIYPMHLIPPDQSQYLPIFKWEGGRRPLRKEEVCNRIVRPSRREESMAIPLPSFIITEQINAEKARLIEEGLWRDRTDTMWVDPNYFHETAPF